MSEDRDRETLRRRALGWSVACTEIAPGEELSCDLELVDGAAGVDLRRVEAVDALDQALRLALTTGLGSDVFNTEFGFDGLRAVGDEPDPVLARERVRVSIIGVLQREPRVRRIVDVKLADDRLGQPVPGSRVLDVRVAFETIAGDQALAELRAVSWNG